MPNADKKFWGQVVKCGIALATVTAGILAYIAKPSSSGAPSAPANPPQSAPAAPSATLSTPSPSSAAESATATPPSSPSPAPVTAIVSAPSPVAPAAPVGKTVISGYVINRVTGLGVRGAEVTARTEPAQSKMSDAYGYFNLTISADYRGRQVELHIGKSGFSDKTFTVEILATGATPNNTYIFEPLERHVSADPVRHVDSETLVLSGTASRPVATKLKIPENSEVTIAATGKVKLGEFMGSTGPAGLNNPLISGLGGMQYKIVQNHKMGTLMWRFVGDGNDDWSGYGADATTFTAPRSGHIEFLVNDNELGNNSGSYKITVKVKKA